MNTLKFAGLLLALIFTISALSLLAAPAGAQVTNLTVTYPNTTNNSLLPGAPTLTIAGDFSNVYNSTSLQVQLLNIITSSQYEPAIISAGPTSIVIDASSLPLGVYSLNVTGAFPGGGSVADYLDPYFTFGSSIIGVSPTAAAAGSQNTTVTVTGTFFENTSTIDWNGSALPTTYISPSSLTAIVPASDLASVATAVITAVSPDNGTTGSVSFNVDAPPTITSISPSTAPAGSPDTTITVTGTGFQYGATADWNGSPLSTTYIGADYLSAIIPAADLVSVSEGDISVVNTDSGTSNTTYFKVGGVPTITGVTPSTIAVGAPDTLMTVTGTNFDPSAIIETAGGLLTPTTVDSSTELHVLFPASDLDRAGTFPFAVTTGTGGGSAPASFVITSLGNFGAPGLKMISVPYDYSGDTLFPTTLDYLDTVTGTEITGGTLPIVTWNGASYISAGEGPDIGVGYWIREPALTDSNNNPETLSIMVPGAIATPGQNFQIPLTAGWNLIGDPFTTPVSIANLGVIYQGDTTDTVHPILTAAQANIVGTELYTYDSTVSPNYQDQSVLASGTTIQPFTGYWFLAIQPCTLVIPPPATTQ